MMNVEKPDHEPEDGPPFQFVPGRYYLLMASFPLPEYLTKFHRGGDFCVLVWRKDDEPAVWHLLYRFRYYKEGPEASPWIQGERGDERSWQGAIIRGPLEQELMQRVLAVLNAISNQAGTNEELEILHINGDCDTFYELVRDGKVPWLHSQEIRQE